MQTYNERLEFCSAICPSNLVVSNMVPDFREVSRLAEEIGDVQAGALAAAWLADGYYIGHQSRKSSYWAMKAAAQSHNPRQLYIAYRALMLDAAYLGDRTSFLEGERATLALLEKITQPTDRVTLWEAMGRARVLLGLPDAEHRFSAGEKDYAVGRLNGDYKPVRLLQIIRSRLVALSKTSHPDKEYAEQLIRDGLLIARGSFDRHVRELETLARTLHLTERVQDVLPH